MDYFAVGYMLHCCCWSYKLHAANKEGKLFIDAWYTDVIYPGHFACIRAHFCLIFCGSAHYYVAYIDEYYLLPTHTADSCDEWWQICYLLELWSILLVNGMITPQNKGWWGLWNFREFLQTPSVNFLPNLGTFSKTHHEIACFSHELGWYFIIPRFSFRDLSYLEVSRKGGRLNQSWKQQ